MSASTSSIQQTPIDKFVRFYKHYKPELLTFLGSAMLASAGLIHAFKDVAWVSSLILPSFILFVVGFIATVAGAILAKEQKKQFDDLNTQIGTLENSKSELDGKLTQAQVDYKALFHHQLAYIAENLGFGPTERISVFLRVGEGSNLFFLLVERFSGDEEYQTSGPQIYPGNEGYLYRALRTDKVHIFDLPNPKQDPDGYVRKCANEGVTITRQAVLSLSMPSRSYLAFPIKESNLSRRVGVVVIESTKEVLPGDHDEIEATLQGETPMMYQYLTSLQHFQTVSAEDLRTKYGSMALQAQQVVLDPQSPVFAQQVHSGIAPVLQNNSLPIEALTIGPQSQKPDPQEQVAQTQALPIATVLEALAEPPTLKPLPREGQPEGGERNKLLDLAVGARPFVAPAVAIVAGLIMAASKNKESASEITSINPNHLIEHGHLKKGEPIFIDHLDKTYEAKIVDGTNVIYNGKALSYQDWGREVVKQGNISIYIRLYVMREGKKTHLQELRKQLLEQSAAQSAAEAQQQEATQQSPTEGDNRTVA